MTIQALEFLEDRLYLLRKEVFRAIGATKDCVVDGLGEEYELDTITVLKITGIRKMLEIALREVDRVTEDIQNEIAEKEK